MAAFSFGLEIDPIEVGSFSEERHLHCTLMHWFVTSLSTAQLLAATREVFSDTGEIELVSEKPALFGRNNETPVHTIAANLALTYLHRRLFDVLADFNPQYLEPQYVGNGYNPHVTTQGDRAFGPGRRFVASKVYIVRAYDSKAMTDRKEFVAKIILKRPFS